MHARAGAANGAPQDETYRDDDWHQHDDEERQAPVQVEHDRHRADQRQRLLQKAADIAGQHGADDGDIGRDAADEFADAPVVVVLDR